MNVLQVLIWIIVGMFLMGLIVWFTMPLLMLIQHKSKLSYAETVTSLSESVNKKQDWKVLTVNDYKKTTEAFVTLEPTASINICNPRYASRILADDRDRGVTAFMPIGIGVYEDKKGQVFVSNLNIGLLGKMFGGTISEVMGAAGKDLGEVIRTVTTV